MFDFLRSLRRAAGGIIARCFANSQCTLIFLHAAGAGGGEARAQGPRC